MKTKIENGIEYRLENEIWYPNLKLKEEGINLGKYGLMRKNFLEEHYRYRFDAMLLTGELYTHCREVEEQAKVMKERLIQQRLKYEIDAIQADLLSEELVVKEIIFI